MDSEEVTVAGDLDSIEKINKLLESLPDEFCAPGVPKESNKSTEGSIPKRVVAFAYWKFLGRHVYCSRYVHEDEDFNVVGVPAYATVIYGDEYVIVKKLEETFKCPERNCTFIKETMAGGYLIYSFPLYSGKSKEKLMALAKKYGRVGADNYGLYPYKGRPAVKPPFYWEGTVLEYNCRKYKKLNARVSKGEFIKRELNELLSAINNSIREHYGWRDLSWYHRPCIGTQHCPSLFMLHDIVGGALDMLQCCTRTRSRSFKDCMRINEEVIRGYVKKQKTRLARALRKEL